MNRYVKSRDDFQLMGKVTDPAKLSDACSTYRGRAGNKSAGEAAFVGFVPCGAVANSLFNDTLRIAYIYANKTKWYLPVKRTGIAWSSDRLYKYSNPSAVVWTDGQWARPPSWPRPLWELEEGLNGSENAGFENEDLIVWMRTAAFPYFRKPYRFVDERDPMIASGLPPGNYMLDVDYCMRCYARAYVHVHVHA